jgi:hypothetical protein
MASPSAPPSRARAAGREGGVCRALGGEPGIRPPARGSARREARLEDPWIEILPLEDFLLDCSEPERIFPRGG